MNYGRQAYDLDSDYDDTKHELPPSLIYSSLLFKSAWFTSKIGRRWASGKDFEKLIGAEEKE